MRATTAWAEETRATDDLGAAVHLLRGVDDAGCLRRLSLGCRVALIIQRRLDMDAHRIDIGGIRTWDSVDGAFVITPITLPVDAKDHP